MREAIIAGAKSRFRLILLASLMTFSGVDPITFATAIRGRFGQRRTAHGTG